MKQRSEEVQEVIEWAHSLMQKDFVVLDTETTNLPANGGEVIQIGIAGKNGGVLINSLIKPKGTISPEAEAIHKIGYKMLEDKPTFAEVYPLLMEVMAGKLIVAFNSPFDNAIFNHSCDLYGLAKPDVEWVDAMIPCAKYRGELRYDGSYKWPKLIHMHQLLCSHIKHSAHDALEDVLMTLEVIQALADKKEINHAPTLSFF